MIRQPALWFLPAAALSLLLTGCASDDTNDDTSASSDPEPSATESPEFVLLGDVKDDVEGAAGTFALTARGSGAPPVAVIEVPEGFSSFGPWMVWPYDDGSDGGDGPPLRALQYWTVNGVYSDPCRRQGAAPEIGPDVDDLVTALAAQRRTEVSAPKPVRVAGYDGVTLELELPDDLAVARCTEQIYMFWEGSPGDAHHQAAPNAVERLWVLDVDGQRVVLATLIDPGVPDRDIDEITAMVESVRFVQPE